MDGSVVRILQEAPAGAQESTAERLRRLKAEMKAAAADEVHTLEAAMDHLIEVASEMLRAPEAFPPGVVEHCRNLVGDLGGVRKSVDLIMRRAD